MHIDTGSDSGEANDEMTGAQQCEVHDPRYEVMVYSRNNDPDGNNNPNHSSTAGLLKGRLGYILVQNELDFL